MMTGDVTDETWKLAREAFLRLEWRNGALADSLPRMTESEYVRLGLQVSERGKSDRGEITEAGPALVEQAKRELQPHLYNALAEVMPKPRRKGGKRGEPRLTEDRVLTAVLGLYKVHHRKPKAAEVANAMGVDRANFRRGKHAREWLAKALGLLSSSVDRSGITPAREDE